MKENPSLYTVGSFIIKGFICHFINVKFCELQWTFSDSPPLHCFLSEIQSTHKYSADTSPPLLYVNTVSSIFRSSPSLAFPIHSLDSRQSSQANIEQMVANRKQSSISAKKKEEKVQIWHRSILTKKLLESVCWFTHMHTDFFVW